MAKITLAQAALWCGGKIDSKYKLAYAAAKRAKIIEQEEYTSYEDGMCVKPVGQALEEILVDQTKMTFK